MSSWLFGLAACLCAVCALALIGGATYQAIQTYKDERRFPPPGQLIDVGGHQLHLHSMGTGGPCVVLEAGLGSISVDWRLVQPQIAQFTRVVSYDRAGTGWSEASNRSRSSSEIVRELHDLLHAAAIPGPYILVGHSYGGIHAQLFAATFPSEVAGLVLVDSCHEAQERKLPQNPLQGGFMQKPVVARLASLFGWSRWQTNRAIRGMCSPIPQEMWDTRMALSLTTKHAVAVNDEISLLTKSLKELENSNQQSFSQIPCIVISAGMRPDLSGLPIEESVKDYMRKTALVWTELQRDLAAKFPRGHQMVAEKSDHNIHWNQPEVVVQAVRRLVENNLGLSRCSSDVLHPA